MHYSRYTITPTGYIARTGSHGHVFGMQVIRVIARTAFRTVTVFATAVQTGQTLREVWDWTNNIGLLW